MSATVHQLDQRLMALTRANEVRLARAGIRHSLRTQPNRATALRALSNLLADLPPEAEGMTLYELLCACRQTGPYAARKFLWNEGIRVDLRLSALSVRRRERLAGWLAGGRLGWEEK
jgi:hypothetical protein